MVRATLHSQTWFRVYRVLRWVVLLVSLVILWQLNEVLVNPEYIPIDDFAHHWGAGKFNLNGQNPYDPRTINDLRNQVAGTNNQPGAALIMWTPPWTLPVVMVFGLMAYPISRLIWLLGMVTILLVTLNISWKLYQGPERMKWLGWVAGFAFAPTISVLEKGQLTPILVLGVAGFLYFTRFPQKGWLAGAAVSLVMFKPQLFYLFWLALPVWVIQQRRWQVVWGCGFVIVSLSLLALASNPLVFTHYYTAILAHPPVEWATPTIGTLLRVIFGADYFWLQFYAPALGSLWFFTYWRHKRKSWNWIEEMPGLLLVSLVTAPYAWTYDQVLLVVPVVHIITLCVQAGWQRVTQSTVVTLVLISSLDLFLHMKLDDFWFFWMAPVIMLWYFIARKYITRVIKHTGS